MTFTKKTQRISYQLIIAVYLTIQLGTVTNTKNFKILDDPYEIIGKLRNFREVPNSLVNNLLVEKDKMNEKFEPNMIKYNYQQPGGKREIKNMIENLKNAKESSISFSGYLSLIAYNQLKYISKVGHVTLFDEKQRLLGDRMDEVFSDFDQHVYEHTMSLDREAITCYEHIVLKLIIGFAGKYNHNHGFLLSSKLKLYYAGAAIIPDVKNPNKMWVTIILSKTHNVRKEFLNNLQEPKKFYQYKKEAKLDFKKYYLQDGFDPKNLSENLDLVSINAIDVITFEGGYCKCSDQPTDTTTQTNNQGKDLTDIYDEVKIAENKRRYPVGVETIGFNLKLACEGGTPEKVPITKTGKKQQSSANRVICYNQLIEENDKTAKYYSEFIKTVNKKIIGAFHGECKCPDGSTHMVGDNKDACGTLACYGGQPGKCIKEENEEYRGTQVVCGRKIDIKMYSTYPKVFKSLEVSILNSILSKKLTLPKVEIKNKVTIDLKNVGGYGGICTCPNGESYMVGDQKDKCFSLACKNGTPSPCEAWDEPFRKGVKVECAVANNKTEKDKATEQ